MRWHNVHIFPFSPTRSVVYSSSLNLSPGLCAATEGPPGPRQRPLPGVSHSSGGQPWDATASPVFWFGTTTRASHPELQGSPGVVVFKQLLPPRRLTLRPSTDACLGTTTQHSSNAQTSTSRPTSWETRTRSGFFMITCRCSTQGRTCPSHHQ